MRFVCICGLLSFLFLDLRAPAQVVFDATNFGAVPRTGPSTTFVDSGAPLRSLIAAISAGTGPATGLTGPFTIYFPGQPGQTTYYDFTTTANQSGYVSHFAVTRSITAATSRLDGLTLAGDPQNPVEFRFHDFTRSGLILNGTRQVGVQDLRMRYERPPFLQGVITALGQNDANTSWVEFDVDPGYPLLDLTTATADARVVNAKYLMVFDPSTRAFHDDGEQMSFVPSATFAGGPAFWVQQPNAAAFPRRYRVLVKKTTFAANAAYGWVANVGDLCVWKCLLGVAASTRETIDCRLDRVTILNSGGAGIYTTMDANLAVDRCAVVPEQGALMSSAFCGVHAKDDRSGPIVTNSRFDGTGDDGVAIAGTWLETITPPAGLNYLGLPNALVVRSRTRIQFRQAASTYSFEIRDTRATAVPRYGLTAKAVHPTQIQYAGTYATGGVTYQVFEMGFNAGDLPAMHIGTDVLACEEFLSTGYAIMNNEIVRNRARAILVKAKDGKISGNIIEGQTSQAIVAGPEFGSFMEASFAHSIVIEDNVIRNVARRHLDASRPGAITVTVAADSVTGLDIDLFSRDNGSITVRRNLLSVVGQAGIFIGCAHEVRIEENLIYSPHRTPFPPGGATGYGFGIDDITAGIHVQNSEDVSLRGNVVEAMGTIHPAVYLAPASNLRCWNGSTHPVWHAAFEKIESDESPRPFATPIPMAPPGNPTTAMHNGVAVTFDGFGLWSDPLGATAALAEGTQSCAAANDGAELRFLVNASQSLAYDATIEALDVFVTMTVTIDPLDGRGPILLDAFDLTSDYFGTGPEYRVHRTIGLSSLGLSQPCLIVFLRTDWGSATKVLIDEVAVR